MSECIKWEWNDVHGLADDGIDGYVKLPRSLLGRSDISAKAKVVFAYMTSKQAGYQFSSKRIAADMKEGYRSVLAAMNELESAGYLEKQRLADGRMLYALRENYWSLTENEAKECLLETFEDAFKPAVVEYDKVTFEQVKSAIIEIVRDGIIAGESAVDFFNTCMEARLPMNTNTLSKWMIHLKH